MKLKLILSPKNMTVRLINLDAQNSEVGGLERDLDCWCCREGQNLTYTVWNNAFRNEANPYKYNRVNIHYTNKERIRVTKSYYCISEVIVMQEMSFDEPFNSNIIE